MASSRATRRAPTSTLRAVRRAPTSTCRRHRRRRGVSRRAVFVLLFLDVVLVVGANASSRVGVGVRPSVRWRREWSPTVAAATGAGGGGASRAARGRSKFHVFDSNGIVGSDFCRVQLQKYTHTFMSNCYWSLNSCRLDNRNRCAASGVRPSLRPSAAAVAPAAPRGDFCRVQLHTCSHTQASGRSLSSCRLRAIVLAGPASSTSTAPHVAPFVELKRIHLRWGGNQRNC